MFSLKLNMFVRQEHRGNSYKHEGKEQLTCVRLYIFHDDCLEAVYAIIIA
jgi:hypothetical protein